MSSTADKIRNSYADLCRQKGLADTIRAYVDLHAMLAETKPEVGDIATASRQDERVLEAIARARGRHIGKTTNRLFRGSGLIVIGSPTELLGAGYATDDLGIDLVDSKYREDDGSYYGAAVKKVAQARTLKKLDSTLWVSTGQYGFMQALLEDSGLIVGRHRIGYAAMDATDLVAGSTGMLPSPELFEELETKVWYPEYVAESVRREELDSINSIDRFGGWFDKTASMEALCQYVTGQRAPIYTEPQPLDRELMNLH